MKACGACCLCKNFELVTSKIEEKIQRKLHRFVCVLNKNFTAPVLLASALQSSSTTVKVSKKKLEKINVRSLVSRIIVVGWLVIWLSPNVPSSSCVDIVFASSLLLPLLLAACANSGWCCPFSSQFSSFIQFCLVISWLLSSYVVVF